MVTFLRYKKYPHAPLSTFLSFVGGLTMAIGVPALLIGLLYLFTSVTATDKADSRIITVGSIIAVAVGFGLKKLAQLLAENKIKKILENRGQVRDLHIQATRMDGNSLYISCPKCGSEVEETNTCKVCGCNIWHTDILYKKDIENIRLSSEAVKILQQKNEQYKQLNA